MSDRTGPDTSGWNDEDYADWFTRNVEGSDLWAVIEPFFNEAEMKWEEARRDDGSRYFDLDGQLQVFPLKDEEWHAIRSLNQFGYLRGLDGITKQMLVTFGAERGDWSRSFAFLSDEKRARFVSQWHAATDRFDTRWDRTVDDDADWDATESYWLNLTLPNGNVVTIIEGDLENLLEGPDQREVEQPASEAPPADPRDQPPSDDLSRATPTDPAGALAALTTSMPGGQMGCLFAALVAVVLAAVVALAVLVGGGDDPVEEAVDPDPAVTTGPAGAEDPGTDLGGETVVDAPSDPKSQSLPSGGIPPQPEIAHPCDLLTTAEVQAATGTGAEANRLVNRPTRMVCDYRTLDEGDPAVTIEAQRSNNAADFLAEFRDQRSDAQVVELDWPAGPAEIRTIDGQVSLWGYVITGDPLGRDVFVWVTIGAPVGDGAAAVETLATRLRDELLAIQPSG